MSISASSCGKCFDPRTRVGCDCTGCSGTHSQECFDPRTRVGCDVQASMVYKLKQVVSIHAPAWGATKIDLSPRMLLIGFDPRTRVGCDVSTQGDRVRLAMFRSTHPRGVRPLQGRLHTHNTHLFRSTHPRGVRQHFRLPQARSEWVSIHAPAWGATGHLALAKPNLEVSIHAPAWGATLWILAVF